MSGWWIAVAQIPVWAVVIWQASDIRNLRDRVDWLERMTFRMHRVIVSRIGGEQ